MASSLSCEEVIQLILILQSMMEEDRVCIQPCFTCLLVQAVKCFIEFFSLHALRAYHHVVGCNTVRVPTSNFLVTSSLNAHVEQCLLIGQVYKVMCNLPPQLLCLMGQKEDLLPCSLDNPAMAIAASNCIVMQEAHCWWQIDSHSWGLQPPLVACEHLNFTTPTICRGKRPPT